MNELANRFCQEFCPFAENDHATCFRDSVGAPQLTTAELGSEVDVIFFGDNGPLNLVPVRLLRT